MMYSAFDDIYGVLVGYPKVTYENGPREVMVWKETSQVIYPRWIKSFGLYYATKWITYWSSYVHITVPGMDSLQVIMKDSRSISPTTYNSAEIILGSDVEKSLVIPPGVSFKLVPMNNRIVQIIMLGTDEHDVPYLKESLE